MSLAHRHPLKPFLSAEEPLLPEHSSGKHDDRIAITPRQLQTIGMGLLVALLLFVGSSFHRHFRRVQQHDLSSCSDRLAAMGLELSAASLSGSTAHQLPTPDGSAASGVNLWEYALQRHSLYLDLGTDMQRNGLVLGGIITQGLTQDELFELPAPRRGSAAKPKLRHLSNPVRAAVLPLHDDEAAVTLHTTIQRALRGLVADSNVWWTPHDLLHTTLWHASTHKNPVEATPEQLAAEVQAVAAVAASHCPIHAVLDRVVISSSGVVMACWQVLPGSTEVAELRAALQAALPHAPPPDQQHVRYPAMLYTTVARLLAPARRPDTSWATGEAWDTVWLQSALVDVLADLSDDLCGLVTTFKEVMFVEEQELLALALNGHFRKHTSRLKCKHTGGHAAAAA